MQKNTYGVDVSSFQSTNLGSYAVNGAKFAFIKLTQATNYKNPNGSGQIASAKANGIEANGYFYATFGNNANSAVLEAQYAVATAKAWGLPAGSYIATDWEEGSGNYTGGSAQANTSAILASMDVISRAGYKPMLYSGAYLLKNAVFTSQIISKYPNSLWVAAYPNGNGVAVSSPNFGYFPSMDGVAIWQFTDKWRGMDVDGNIAVISTSNNSSSSVASNAQTNGEWHPEVKYNELGRFKITKPNGAKLYNNANLVLEASKDVRKCGETYKIFNASKGAVCAGTGQFFSQADGSTKINPLAVNASARVTCKVVEENVYTQNELKPSAGIKHLPKGSTWNVFGRKGKYLIVGSEKDGKYVDGDKCRVILW
ncbi:GH25 family lysozyme [Lactobacillus hominis]|uniref:Lysin n=1 Tax=Lactobacillus hominis DSM 23910 = CRBIP 24.179 TaxID=1423758 RepID=I7JUV6_9LACO|nr:GH25 family lysozyme [Lactobacillus hominis]KRM85728.1 glycosyl hydrolase family 25 [Lactobacillus hominis DSM 23910 = CRBIP 24.179]MCT3347225.1 glycosyl hydrolase family 25 [Lactobacillus hominis]CCI81751.1 Lysin [Lactobacillus hominis DSM 23910 = CRBIP 24.179]